MWRRGLIAALAAPGLAGCVLLLPGIVRDLGDRGDAVSGLDFFRYEGKTASGARYEVRYLLDVGEKRRYMVTYLEGSVLSSGWEDVGADLEAAHRIYGGVVDGKAETDVRARFGAPTQVTDSGTSRLLWYVRGPHEAYALLFRGGRCVAAVRTTQADMEHLLARPSPL